MPEISTALDRQKTLTRVVRMAKCPYCKGPMVNAIDSTGEPVKNLWEHEKAPGVPLPDCPGRTQLFTSREHSDSIVPELSEEP